MSLQDEIQKLSAKGDPKTKLTEMIRGAIEDCIKCSAENAYNEICKRIASKTVLGVDVDNYVTVGTSAEFPIFENNPLWREFYDAYPKCDRTTIIKQFPDTEISWGDYRDRGVLHFALRKGGANTARIVLTSSGKRMLDALAQLCARDSIQITPGMAVRTDRMYGSSSGKDYRKTATTKVGQVYFKPILGHERRIDSVQLIAYYKRF